MPLFSQAMVGILGCWMVSSSLWMYPHSISYFNESIGGPLNGPRHLLGSNVDWGQDLLYLRGWMSTHHYFNPLELAHEGGADSSVSGPSGFMQLPITDAGNYVVALQSDTGAPALWAASVALTQGALEFAFDKSLGTKFHGREKITRHLLECKTMGRASYSIVLFSIETKN